MFELAPYCISVLEFRNDIVDYSGCDSLRECLAHLVKITSRDLKVKSSNLTKCWALGGGLSLPFQNGLSEPKECNSSQN